MNRPLERSLAGSSVIFWVGSLFPLGFGLVLATDLINQSEFISYTVVVLVYGIATGSTLSWLLNHDAQTHSQRTSAAW
jgi:hypothetical protein